MRALGVRARRRPDGRLPPPAQQGGDPRRGRGGRDHRGAGGPGRRAALARAGRRARPRLPRGAATAPERAPGGRHPARRERGGPAAARCRARRRAAGGFAPGAALEFVHATSCLVVGHALDESGAGATTPEVAALQAALLATGEYPNLAAVATCNPATRSRPGWPPSSPASRRAWGAEGGGGRSR